MSNRELTGSPITDYEPLRPFGKVSEINQGDEFDGEEADWTRVSPSPTPKRVEPVTASQTSEPRSVGAAQSTTVSLLRRGHGLSYIGIFVFTILVYLRPYELTSWLSWTSSTAFWVGLATLAIYVPTQLGLENQLTIHPWELKLVLLFLFLAMLSVMFAYNQKLASGSFSDLFKVIVVFVVLVNVVRTERRLHGLILFMLFTSVILSTSAVYQYSTGNFNVELHERIKGIIGNLFDNPNDLALHLVTMIPLSLVFFINARNPFKKLLFAAIAVIMAAGVMATFSRGGFIGLAAIGGMLTWRIARRNRLLVIMILPILLAGFIAFAPKGYGTRIRDTADDSGTARFDELKRSIFVSIYHPLIGVGMNNYIVFSNLNHATHNAYTQVSAEMGFPAMVVYVLFLLTALKRLRKVSQETSARDRSRSSFHYMAIGLEASIFGYMVSSFFLSVAYLWYIYYLVGYEVCFCRIYEASVNETSLTKRIQQPAE